MIDLNKNKKISEGRLLAFEAHIYLPNAHSDDLSSQVGREALPLCPFAYWLPGLPHTRAYHCTKGARGRIEALQPMVVLLGISCQNLVGLNI